MKLLQLPLLPKVHIIVFTFIQDLKEVFNILPIYYGMKLIFKIVEDLWVRVSIKFELNLELESAKGKNVDRTLVKNEALRGVKTKEV